MQIALTPDQQDAIMRPLGRAQRGGFQRLFERLQAGVNQATGVLTLSPADAERVIHYANDFGQGTYQSKLREIVPAVEQALARLPRAATPNLFGEADHV